jgi:predicted dehydrogenase
VQATLDTLIKERPVRRRVGRTAAVDVDDIALLHAAYEATAYSGVVEVSRMGTGLTNDLSFEIFGELGAIRFSAARPQLAGGLRRARRGQANRRHARLPQDRGGEPLRRPEGAGLVDDADFVRTHAECQYQFLRSAAEGRPASPSIVDGLHIQAVMAAAERAAAEGRWVEVDEVLG